MIDALSVMHFLIMTKVEYLMMFKYEGQSILRLKTEELFNSCPPSCKRVVNIASKERVQIFQLLPMVSVVLEHFLWKIFFFVFRKKVVFNITFFLIFMAKELGQY